MFCNIHVSDAETAVININAICFIDNSQRKGIRSIHMVSGDVLEINEADFIKIKSLCLQISDYQDLSINNQENNNFQSIEMVNTSIESIGAEDMESPTNAANMKDGDIVREIANIHGIRLNRLAEILGYSSASGLVNRLNVEHGMQSDVLARILEALESELIIRDKDGREWIVKPKE